MKEAYLYISQQSAWLYIALVDEDKLALLAAEDLVVMDISIGELQPETGHVLTARMSSGWAKPELRGKRQIYIVMLESHGVPRNFQHYG